MYCAALDICLAVAGACGSENISCPVQVLIFLSLNIIFLFDLLEQIDVAIAIVII